MPRKGRARASPLPPTLQLRVETRDLLWLCAGQALRVSASLSCSRAGGDTDWSGPVLQVTPLIFLPALELEGGQGCATMGTNPAPLQLLSPLQSWKKTGLITLARGWWHSHHTSCTRRTLGISCGSDGTIPFHHQTGEMVKHQILQ